MVKKWVVMLQSISNSTEILLWAFVGVSYFGIFRVAVAEKLTKCFRTCLPSNEFRVDEERVERDVICRGSIE